MLKVSKGFLSLGFESFKFFYQYVSFTLGMQINDFLTLCILLSLFSSSLKLLGFLFQLLDFLFKVFDFSLRPFIRRLETLNIYHQSRRLDSGPLYLILEIIELRSQCLNSFTRLFISGFERISESLSFCPS